MTGRAPAGRPRAARAVACALAASAALRTAAARAEGCEELRWDLDDALRELVEARVARGRPLAPADVQLALRRRGLTAVDPVLRFASRPSAHARDAGALHDLRVGAEPEAGAPFPCVAERASPEGRASLRVSSPAIAFDADPVDAGLRVRVRLADAHDGAVTLVLASLAGPVRALALTLRGGRGEALLPIAREGADVLRAAVLQIVADTPAGPEVIAERWLGDAEAIAAARVAADARAPRGLARGLAEERAALGLPVLVRSAALERFAEESLAQATARGALAHRTAAGLVEERLRSARIAHGGAGELLARIPAGADAASRFAASPAHRAILGDAALTHVGAATRRGPDGLDWIVVVLASLAHDASSAPLSAPARPSHRGSPPRPSPRRP